MRCFISESPNRYISAKNTLLGLPLYIVVIHKAFAHSYPPSLLKIAIGLRTWRSVSLVLVYIDLAPSMGALATARPLTGYLQVSSSLPLESANQNAPVESSSLSCTCNTQFTILTLALCDEDRINKCAPKRGLPELCGLCLQISIINSIDLYQCLPSPSPMPS